MTAADSLSLPVCTCLDEAVAHVGGYRGNGGPGLRVRREGDPRRLVPLQTNMSHQRGVARTDWKPTLVDQGPARGRVTLKRETALLAGDARGPDR